MLSILWLAVIACVTVTPIAELCNGRDDDQDGVVDNGLDYDADGYLPCATEDQPPDCNDRDARVHPGATEACDHLDDDCDGVLPPEEQDLDMDGAMTCNGDCDDLDAYRNTDDWDGDLYSSCGGSPDCNDYDATVHPGAPEICDGLDSDCDGSPLGEEGDADRDGQRGCDGDCDDTDASINNLDVDGDGVTSCAGDCADDDTRVAPDAIEACDGIDNDCDAALLSSEVDLDGDGAMVCEGDCADTDPARFAGNPEICDEIDNNCDGQIPDDEHDGDGDGYYPGVCGEDCDDTDAELGPHDWDADGYTPCDPDPDCDDRTATTYPGAPRLCNGVDDDCDGAADEEGDYDLDADGHAVCTGDDCDDGDVHTYAGATERCDGVDNDCDGRVPADETDDDLDGYVECGVGAGPALPDCDDADPDVHPHNPEACGDDVDGDCDGDPEAWTRYADLDGDHFGGDLSTVEACDWWEGYVVVDYDGDGVTDAAWSVDAGDCNDGDPLVSPAQPEVADDGVDNDCDGDLR